MCWNWEISLVSFVIISVVSYALYQRGKPNDKFLSIWIASYGSMQLFEMFQWLGQGPAYQYLNIFGSLCGALLLYLHPFAFATGMTLDSAYSNIVSSTLFKGIIAFTVGFALFGFYRVVTAYLEEPHRFISVPHSSSKHMVWNYPSDYNIAGISMISIATLFIAPRYLLFYAGIMLYYLLPLIMIYITSDDKNKNILTNFSGTGSYWCWYVATFAFLFYFR
jgi:hypothetical protein